ncbi:MAG: twin arginine-targeting protein translocase TatC [Spirochaetes bacterium RBG_13_51_14]|nr:MAG: twin arginine-targeting protein translocase TatC [Spirochaetes bacterium RBG_13_51_14]
MASSKDLTSDRNKKLPAKKKKSAKKKTSKKSTRFGDKAKTRSAAPRRRAKPARRDSIINPLITQNTVEGSPGKTTTHQKDLITTLTEYDDANKDVDANDEDIDPEADDRGDAPMTVVGHLDELRSRILISLITIVILTVGAFVFSDKILHFITKPFTITGFKLNVFKLTEGFMIRLKVSAITALLIGFPFLMWQTWRFILPAITKNDRMFSRLSVISSVLLFYAGVVFVFILLVPFTVKMLLGFVSREMMSTIGANDYISLVFFFCVIMGILFELPIIMMILTRIGIITPSFLVRKRKYAIVLAFVISAVITPTQDLLSQLIVTVPLILLYEASVIVSKLTTVRKKKRELEG